MFRLYRTKFRHLLSNEGCNVAGLQRCEIKMVPWIRDSDWSPPFGAIGLRQGDIFLERGAHVRCEGKGRKQRCTPLTRTTVQALRAWVREQRKDEAKILFPSARGGQLSHDSVQYLVAKYAKSAAKSCVALRKKRVTPSMVS